MGGGGGREEGKGERGEEEGRLTRVTRSTMNEGSLFVIGSRKLKLDRMANPDVPKLGRQEALLFLFIQFQQLLDIDPHAEREREGPWSERRSSRARFRGCFVIVEEKRLACSFCKSQTSNPSLFSPRPCFRSSTTPTQTHQRQRGEQRRGEGVRRREGQQRGCHFG